MLEKLRSFQEVAELGSVSLSAKKLSCTQPAISQHINFLETYYGVKLFKRAGGRMVLTPEGQQLYIESQKLTAAFQNLQETFTKEGFKKKDTLRFAAIDSATISVLPGALKTLMDSHPGIKLFPKIYSSRMAIQNVLNDSIDIAICVVDNPPPTLGFEIIFEEKMVIIGSKNHQAIKDPAELAKESFILFPSSSMTRQRIDQVFQNLKIAPEVILETYKLFAVVSLVESGVGLSVVPYFSVYGDILHQRVFQIPIETSVKRSIGVVYKKGIKLPLVVMDFIYALREESKKLINPNI